MTLVLSFVLAFFVTLLWFTQEKAHVSITKAYRERAWFALAAQLFLVFATVWLWVVVCAALLFSVCWDAIHYMLE